MQQRMHAAGGQQQNDQHDRRPTTESPQRLSANNRITAVGAGQQLICCFQESSG
jgi:hypothetical protein